MKRFIPFLFAILAICMFVSCNAEVDVMAKAPEVLTMDIQILQQEETKGMSTDSLYTTAMEPVSYQYRAVCVTTSGAPGTALEWTNITPTDDNGMVSASLPSLARGTWDIHMRARNSNGGVILQGSSLGVVLSVDHQAVSLVLRNSVSDYSVASPSNVAIAIGVSVPTQTQQEIMMKYTPIEEIGDLNTSGTGGYQIQVSTAANRITEINGSTIIYNTVRNGWTACYGTMTVQPGYYVVQILNRVHDILVSGEVFAVRVEESSPFAVNGTLNDGELINMDMSGIETESIYLDIQNAEELNARFEAITGTDQVYSTTRTYEIGDYVIHNNVLYRCTTAVTSAESFDLTKWQTVDLTSLTEMIYGIDEELLAIQADIEDINSLIDGVTDDLSDVAAALEAVGDDVEDHESELEAIAGSITSINSSISTINGRITSLQSAVDAKMEAMTVDEAPTSGSTNLVSSGGVYSAISTLSSSISNLNSSITQINTALAGKQAALTFDSSPTSGSPNPVTSSGVYTAIGSVQSGLDTLSSSLTSLASRVSTIESKLAVIDTTPRSGSSNLITSGGVYDAINAINSRVLADLRTKSVSFSNPTNGIVDTGLSRSSYLVIGAYCSDRNGWDCCINSGSSSKWHVRIFDAEDSSVISGSGTLEVFYIPL